MRSNQSILKEINPEYSWKDWCWSWNSNTLATWCKERTHWKRPWCWERLKAEGERDDRGWDGWMASPTRRTWIWVSSRSWWWAGKPGMLQSMGSQWIRHDWAAELNWRWWKYHFNIRTHINQDSFKKSNLFRAVILNSSCMLDLPGRTVSKHKFQGTNLRKFWFNWSREGSSYCNFSKIPSLTFN